jgi:hypothetical protein
VWRLSSDGAGLQKPDDVFKLLEILKLSEFLRFKSARAVLFQEFVESFLTLSGESECAELFRVGQQIDKLLV